MILLGNMFLSGWDGGQDIFLADLDVVSDSIEVAAFKFVRRIDATIRRPGPDLHRWLNWWTSHERPIDRRLETDSDYVAVRFIQLEFDYYGLGWSYIRLDGDRIGLTLSEDRTTNEITAHEQAACIAERNRLMHEKLERAGIAQGAPIGETPGVPASSDRALLVKLHNEYRNVIS